MAVIFSETPQTLEREASSRAMGAKLVDAGGMWRSKSGMAGEVDGAAALGVSVVPSPSLRSYAPGQSVWEEVQCDAGKKLVTKVEVGSAIQGQLSCHDRLMRPSRLEASSLLSPCDDAGKEGS